MSLRTIHVVVILTAIATLIFFGVYFQTVYGLWAQVSLILGILLVPYLFWFLKKLSKLK